jgi:hypothetical protein
MGERYTEEPRYDTGLSDNAVAFLREYAEVVRRSSLCVEMVCALIDNMTVFAHDSRTNLRLITGLLAVRSQSSATGGTEVRRGEIWLAGEMDDADDSTIILFLWDMMCRASDGGEGNSPFESLEMSLRNTVEQFDEIKDSFGPKT